MYDIQLTHRFLKFKEAELDSFYVMREGTKKALLQTILNTKVRSFLGTFVQTILKTKVRSFLSIFVFLFFL